MITEELLGFIRGQYAAGMSVDEMKHLLIAEGGWETADIDEALQAIGIPAEETSPTPSDIPSVTENEVSETLPLTTVSSVQYAPSLEILTPSRGGSIQDTTFTGENDDFLGIFSPHQHREEEIPEKEHTLPESFVVSIPPEIPALTVNPPPPPAVLPMTFAAAIPVVKEPEVMIDMTPQETAEVASSFQVPEEVIPPIAITPPHEPSPLPPLPVLPNVTSPSAASDAPGRAEASKVSAPKTPPVTFNLSMLRKSIADESGAAAVNAESPDAGKIIETKSVAELWLQGARKQAGSSTGVTPNAVPSGIPVRPKILSRRTMSSDILLRGVGGAIPGMPAISVPEEAPKLHPQVDTASGFKAPETKASTAGSVPSSARAAPVQPLVLHAQASSGKFPIKRVASILVGVIVLAAIVGGGWYMFLKLRGPNLSMIYGNAFQQFFDVTSFGYHGSATTNLVLSTATDGVDRSGTVEFTFDYAGLLANGAEGYGDGLHHIKFKGGLHSGNFHWVTDLESDVRLIGSAIYFHVLAFPDTSNADPDLFRTYWVQLDLADVAKELALEGVGGEGYGDFGSGSKDTAFNSLIQQKLPFSAGARLPDEILASGPAYHFQLKSNPDQMIALAQMLYHKYMNADLTLDANQQLRLKDALAKIGGDVLIDQKTNTLLKLSFKGDLDDDIVGVHVKGPLSFTFDLSDFNKPVAVEIPTPMLTLEEIRVRMDDYKRVKEKRTRDTIKQNGATEIQSALEAYRTEKGRYPTFLVDLVSSGKISTSTMSEITLKTYLYAAYVKPEVLTKSGLCTARGKVCTYYHLGVNFDDMTNPLLGNDADQNTELRGGDATGCGGEQDVACYDVVPAPVDPSLLPESSASVSVTPKSVP
jgi:type II secretory pathway pseudopilin PulG